MDEIKAGFIGIIFTGLLFTVLVLFAGNKAYTQEQKELQTWEKFKVDHKCKMVAKTDEMYLIRERIPEQEGWKCDDSITYFKKVRK